MTFSIKNQILKIFPDYVSHTIKNYRILSTHLGQLKSMRLRQSIDKDGAPIPWYTYPAIEYIKQLDFSDKHIFEYGSGNSTLFWAKRAKTVTSVESNKNWFLHCKTQMPPNVNLILCEDTSKYAQSILNENMSFDVIIIDGAGLPLRLDCAKNSLQKLNENGFIILDNSDWLIKTSEFLRQSNLIEVDMSGFGPINSFSWQTSFFFTRNVELIPLRDQPSLGVGGVPRPPA